MKTQAARPSSFAFLAALLALLLGLLASLALVYAAGAMVSASTLTVDTLLDEADGSCSNGDCSLRDAITVAAEGDTIVFEAAIAGGTIYLESGLVISKSLAIDGEGRAITLSGDTGGDGTEDVRVLHITGAHSVALSHLTIADGRGVEQESCNPYSPTPIECGGGLMVEAGAVVTVSHSTISGCLTTERGAGIYNAGDLRVFDSAISGSQAGWDGGAIFNHGALQVISSTLSHNQATDGWGGGIYNEGVLEVVASTISSNQALHEHSRGGGILNGGNLTLQSSAVYDNFASSGGGIYDYDYDATLSVISSNISTNQAIYIGGGIASECGRILISDSVIRENSANGGGGIFVTEYTRILVQNSTISGNRANYDGGGIYNWGTLIVRNSTINDNQARYGGGIFDASPNGAGSLQGSTISGNQAEQGGGIGSAGLLLLQNSAVLSNTASDAGGGIAGSETIVVKSVISGNQAVRGGGIINWGILTAQDSTLQANAASSYGGGVMNDYSGIAVLETSTLRDNTATQAGGGVLTVNYESILALENSTLSGNQAGQGGGLYLGNNPSIAFVQNSTLAGNQAGQGGGIYAQQPGYPWSDFLSLHLLNTIVADSPSGGGLKINRHNLIEDGSCSPLLSGDPLLGPLADNGGATWTHALLDGSPAIDAGDAALYPLADQRGELRPFDGDGDGQAGCDIGAYEVMLRYDSQVTITTDLPDPSVVGQPVTVTFSMAGDPPEAGTPGGTLIVNDGVGDYCIAEASEGECTLIPTSAGDLTLTAAYAGDCNFAASSDSVAHRVDYYTMLLPLVMK